MLPKTFPKTSRSSKTMLSAFAILMVAYFSYSWVVSPQLSYLHAARQYIDMIGSKSQKLDLIQQRNRSKEKKIEMITQEINQKRQLFFTRQSAREFLSDLEPLALQCTCVITSQASLPPDRHQQSTEEVDTSVASETVALNINGSYQNLMKFFDKLKSYPQKIFIQELLIESRGLQKKELTCFTVLSIYIIQDKEIITDE